MRRLYLAYGSNLNIEQMKLRCPTAKLVGALKLNSWALEFRGENKSAVATIRPKKGSKVPVIVWDLKSQDEKSLDRYEGYPHLYRKVDIKLEFKGKPIKGFLYIINPGRTLATPGKRYYDVIKQGYKEAGFDIRILDKALRYSKTG